MTTSTTALGIIDAQRGFMPAEEGQRLGAEGFGELPITRSQEIVPRVNDLITASASANTPVFITQDWHPANTAHFSSEPNFDTTWPVHCVGGTDGAKLHPEINVPANAFRIRKGMEELDTSYSGVNGESVRGVGVVEWARDIGVTEIVLGGLALDYCVKATAVDLKDEGFDVAIVSDAVESVSVETGHEAIRELEAKGVRFITTDEYMRNIREKLAEM